MNIKSLIFSFLYVGLCLGIQACDDINGKSHTLQSSIHVKSDADLGSGIYESKSESFTMLSIISTNAVQGEKQQSENYVLLNSTIY